MLAGCRIDEVLAAVDCAFANVAHVIRDLQVTTSLAYLLAVLLEETLVCLLNRNVVASRLSGEGGWVGERFRARKPVQKLPRVSPSIPAIVQQRPSGGGHVIRQGASADKHVRQHGHPRLPPGLGSAGLQVVLVRFDVLGGRADVLGGHRKQGTESRVVFGTEGIEQEEPGGGARVDPAEFGGGQPGTGGVSLHAPRERVHHHEMGSRRQLVEDHGRSVGTGVRLALRLRPLVPAEGEIAHGVFIAHHDEKPRGPGRVSISLPIEKAPTCSRTAP
ncbi:hypothetical protein DM02DRAFT_327413 [Periconia macrospinosa]|uniref:Uncharacterized protein n=1 Tax=Periconia macrospinosa TaxID=97972 RepID=A0A2V1EBD6_9PLEO|nr:hypothetical protein DM02DRAFT_327413 [Periconia macrospinosa]